MQVKYTIDAFASLTHLINFIEINNTAGAGIRWVNKYEQFIEKTFLNTQHKRLLTMPLLKNWACAAFILMIG